MARQLVPITLARQNKKKIRISQTTSKILKRTTRMIKRLMMMGRRKLGALFIRSRAQIIKQKIKTKMRRSKGYGKALKM